MRTSPLLIVASVACLLAGSPGCGVPERDDGAGEPNILLITLDTTRADRLGCYGYTRPTSPHLDALAGEARVFERVWSTSNWTLPAHASLFTGLLPTSHGATSSAVGSLVLGDAIAGERFRTHRARPLDPAAGTLAEALRARGYATAGIVAGPWLKRVFGLDRGFDRWDDAGIQSIEGRSAADVTDLALEWLSALHRPFLLFLNYFDAHTPYALREEALRAIGVDPAPLRARMATGRTTPSDRRALYDGEIRYMDGHIGRLLARLRELGEWERTWIVVTADHGEMLGEHQRWGHGFELYEPVLRIPLIVKQPGAEGPRGREDAPASLTDVFPLLASHLSLELPARARGRVPEPGQRTILAETWSRPEPRAATARPAGAPPSPVAPAEEEAADPATWRVLVHGDWKLHMRAGEAPRLFHLGKDPGEATDVSRWNEARRAELVAELRSAISALSSPDARAPEREVDDTTLESLRSLGYVE